MCAGKLMMKLTKIMSLMTLVDLLRKMVDLDYNNPIA